LIVVGSVGILLVLGTVVYFLTRSRPKDRF
jgi:hypothetical protein